MKAIKLVTGVTPTCWRPPFGDVDDRIRAIAHALGLQTIIWQHDSFDWEVSAGKVTPEQVDDNYNNFIQLAQNGSLDTVCIFLADLSTNSQDVSGRVHFINTRTEQFHNVRSCQVLSSTEGGIPGRIGFSLYLGHYWSSGYSTSSQSAWRWIKPSRTSNQITRYLRLRNVSHPSFHAIITLTIFRHFGQETGVQWLKQQR